MLIRLFEARDQAAAKALINAGLGEHFGFVDESFNPDLNDIGAAFAGGCFLIGERAGHVIATGGYIPLDSATVKVERVSVRADARRGGVASRLFDALLEHARAAGYKRAVLETTSTWPEVIAFWQRNGFRITHVVDDTEWPETWFERDVDAP